MANKELPPHELLRKLLGYEPDTGKLFWLERPASMFHRHQDALTWNKRFCGKEALGALNAGGYKHGYIIGSKFLAHRIIWKMFFGSDPVEIIDHVNGNKTDNRVTNLREASASTNGRNTKLHSRNTSGHIGVCWDRQCGKWKAQIGILGENKNLGVFERIEDAISARIAAQKENGFSERHGK